MLCLQVTYNTLIDVYGKLGQWEQALQVLRRMKYQVCIHTPLVLRILFSSCMSRSSCTAR